MSPKYCDIALAIINAQEASFHMTIAVDLALSCLSYNAFRFHKFFYTPFPFCL
jgi:hypothetical protein